MENNITNISQVELTTTIDDFKNDIDTLKDNNDTLRSDVDTLTNKLYSVSQENIELKYQLKKRVLWADFLNAKIIKVKAILDFITTFVFVTPWYRWLFKKTRQEFKKGINEIEKDFQEDVEYFMFAYFNYSKEDFLKELEEEEYGS